MATHMALGNTISTAVSGLVANARRVGVVADNIANVATPGFVPNDVVTTTVVAGRSGRAGAAGAGVRAFVRPSVPLGTANLEAANVDVADQYTRMMQARTAYRLGVGLIRTGDRMLAATLDETA